MQKLPIKATQIIGGLMLLTASGCVSATRQFPATKWAMDDERYAQEHREPYSPYRDVRRDQKIWDATDASFQEGNCGVYVGGGSSTVKGFPAAIGSTGIFKMPTSWSTIRGGVFGMDNGGIGAGGVDGEVRVHAPTRFAPYIGLSGDAGISGLSSRYPYRGSNYTAPNHKVTTLAGVAMVAPEAGISYWLNSTTRLNAGASYYFAAGQTDFLVIGASLEFVIGEDFSLDSFSNLGSIGRRPLPRRPASDVYEGGDFPDDGLSNPYFIGLGQSAHHSEPVEMNADSDDVDANDGEHEDQDVQKPARLFDSDIEILSLQIDAKRS